VIAGEGSQRAELQRKIEELKIESIVQMVGFRSDAFSLMNAADMLVLPSSCEPFGLVLIEAMMARRPVVAIRAGGPLDIVVDRSTGLLVPPSLPAEMADAIIELLTNPTKRRTMGERGHERYLSHFTARQMALRTLDVYRQAVSGTLLPLA
jgi:glycogen(starch) synthase